MLYYLLSFNIIWGVIDLVVDPRLLENDLDSVGVALTVHFHFLMATLLSSILSHGIWTPRRLSIMGDNWYKSKTRAHLNRVLPVPPEWLLLAKEFGTKVGQFEDTL